MLTSKEAKIPNNLISVAKKTPGMTAGIVCADHDSSMESAKKAIELDLIKPFFIGDKNIIKEYTKRFKKFGATPEGSFWISKKRQDKRFEM